MNFVSTVTLDLAKYRAKGEVVLALPSFRKIVQMRNRSVRAQVSKDGAELVAENSGDLEVMATLCYVRSAPFETDLDSFLNFCDMLDEGWPGSAMRFYDDMRVAIADLDSGKTSPLDSSGAMETPRSD